ncbi:hypothetical protein DL768_007120 [Monosporascus sp. mg162]|nr:hypothetical protein DL768_007120 [Monosporascus sp. mg162]
MNPFEDIGKAAEEFGQGLAKGADEFGQGLAKGADEVGQWAARVSADLGEQVAPHAQHAVAEICTIADKSKGDIEQLRNDIRDKYEHSDDAECANALRCWIEGAIRGGKDMAEGFKHALDRVHDAVHQFVEEHPVLSSVVATLLALAVMALLVFASIHALGFLPTGVAAGKLND